MEEEINMLFRLSQPENWRNSICPFNTIFGIEAQGGESSEGDDQIQSFWNEIGLGSYCQLDFDLSLTLQKGSFVQDTSSYSNVDGAIGGFLFNNPKESVAAKESHSAYDKDQSQLEIMDSVNTGWRQFFIRPPNDLHLANVLRISQDCPFSDIRKQASNVLFLIKEKGGILPSVLYEGPTTFIPSSDWPSIDVEQLDLESDEERFDADEAEEFGGDDDAIVESCKTLEEFRSIGHALESKKARLLSEAFLSSGRIDHTIQLMAYHPDYLEIFLKTHHFLMRGDGPLPYNHRNYIAIMAAARYQCSYLMELQKREFLYQGGDPKWLRGLDAAPAKLMALYNINKIMAHRPWVLKKEDFLHLTKKAGWSLSEVVQAVVILAHFHALSSFIHGCGITPEIDFDKGHSYMDPGNFNTFRSVSEVLRSSGEGAADSEPKVTDNSSPSVSFAMDQPTPYFGSRSTVPSSDLMLNKGNNKQTKSILKKTEVVSTTTANNSSNNNPSSTPPNNLLKDATHQNSLAGVVLANSPPRKGLGSSVSEVEIIMATMRNLSETSPIEDPEERKKRFENVASSDDSQEKENLLSHSLNKGSTNIPPEISPFVCDPEFIYEDFAKRGQVSELHTFRIQDYSWEEHGFSLVNRLYTEVGVYLDEKFKVTQGMTYYTMGGRAHVDTTKFRTAVWNYIQCLFGIRHDDYDYGEVNQLLERPLKAYIKTVCCYPERITKADYDNVMREFKHSEKVHVNLMIMEAKIQAELLYALRTIMRFMI